MAEIKKMNDVKKLPIIQIEFICYQDAVIDYMNRNEIMTLEALLSHFKVNGHAVAESKKSGGKRMIFSIKGLAWFINCMVEVLEGQRVYSVGEQDKQQAGDFA